MTLGAALAPARPSAEAMEALPTVSAAPQAVQGAPVGPDPSLPPASVVATLIRPGLPRERVDAQDAIAKATASYPCARLSATWERDEGAVMVAGHVSSPQDRDKLLGELARIPGVGRVRAGDLHVVGEPYCHVLTFLDRPSLARSQEQRHGIAAIGEPAQAGVLRLTAGMALELKLSAPDFESYVYVDYFTGDGQVYHLLPNTGADHRFVAKQHFTLGGQKGLGLKARIGPPYGLDMVVAVASSRPLLPHPRQSPEPAGRYLAALETAIGAAERDSRGLKLEYAYYLIQTAPR